MKKTIALFLLLTLTVCAVCALTACNDEEQAPAKKMTLVLETSQEAPTVYEVNLDGVAIESGLVSILEKLKTEQGLSYAVKNGAYGSYLTQVGELSEDAVNGVYLYIYTSVEKDFDVSAYATTVEYGGKSLTSAGVGISALTIEDDCIIYVKEYTYAV